MGDLISRKEVLNLIDNMYQNEKDLIRSVYVRDSIKVSIKEIPTAYDLDAVVEQLEEEKELSYADFEGYARDVSPWLKAECDDNFSEGLERAVRIVKLKERTECKLCAHCDTQYNACLVNMGKCYEEGKCLHHNCYRYEEAHCDDEDYTLISGEIKHFISEKEQIKSMNKIYISGPITGIQDYMKNFDKAEKELKSVGFSVVNPAKVLSQMPADTEYEEYMDMSMMMLSMCDSIYMLKGWEKSTGANREYGYALASDITIMREIKEK